MGWVAKASWPRPGFQVMEVLLKLNDKLYSVTERKTVHEYDPATNRWTQKASYPGGLYSLLGLGVSGIGYVGSYQVGNYDFWAYNPHTDTWTKKNNHPFTETCSGSYEWQTFSIGSRGYAIGALSGNVSCRNVKFCEYDPATDSWTTLAAFPGAFRAAFAANALGNNVYLVGGADVHEPNFNFYKDVWRYDRTANEWTNLPNFPGQGRHFPFCFSQGGYLYVGGGQNSSLTYLKDFWAFDEISWTRIDDLPSARASYFGASTSGYVASGYDGSVLQDLLFYDNPPRGRTLRFRWSIRQLAAGTNKLLWKVARDVVGNTSAILWTINSAVGNTSKLLWHIGGPVGRSNQVRWTIKPAVGRTSMIRWRAFNPPVGKTVTMLWAVRTAAGRSNQVRWKQGPICDPPIEFTVYGQSGSDAKSTNAKFADCVP